MLSHIFINDTDKCLLLQALALLEADYEVWLNGAEIDHKPEHTEIILTGFYLRQRITDLKNKIKKDFHSH